MTDEDAIKILKITHGHATSYEQQGNEACVIAINNTAWHILRGFGFEHLEIVRLNRAAKEGG